MANTIVLGLDRYPIQDEEYERLELLNFIFSIVFTIEVILKLTGLGLRGFVMDRFNIFDAFVVTIGFVDVLI